MELRGIEAISFDFFNTLVFHREGRGRGQAVIDYLRACSLEPAPWRHEVLYTIFRTHDADYAPEAPAVERHDYYVTLARRLFEALEVAIPDDRIHEHAAALWRRLGPACFSVFPDAVETVRSLNRAGYPLAIISNWPRGLRHFCAELGLAKYFDHVLASGELGAAKPDGRIFVEACRRLKRSPTRVLHVGDSLTDDYLGGEASGLRVALIDRAQAPRSRSQQVIHDLRELVRDVDFE